MPPDDPSESQSLDDALVAAGATPAEIARARAEGWLPLLALDRALLPGTPIYDVDGLAASVSIAPDEVVGLWRALGFPDVPPGARVFTEHDAAALRLLFDRYRRFPELAADASFSHVEEQVRAISAALSRIAALEAEDFAQGLDLLRTAGLDDEQVAAELTRALDWADLAALLDYAHRVQLRAMLWRRLARPLLDDDTSLAVAFADIVGYTAIAQELTAPELSALLGRFERQVYDTVARQGARVVKSLGDAVMFVGLAASVARVSLELRDGLDGVPPLRQGASYGPVLARDGDVFGPTVNLASRLTDVARPGTVLISQPLRDALVDEPSLELRRLRPRRLRGIGEVPMYALLRRDA